MEQQRFNEQPRSNQQRARGESKDRADKSGIQGVRRQAVSQEFDFKSDQPPAVSMVTVAETVTINQVFHF